MIETKLQAVLAGELARLVGRHDTPPSRARWRGIRHPINRDYRGSTRIATLAAGQQHVGQIEHADSAT